MLFYLKRKFNFKLMNLKEGKKNQKSADNLEMSIDRMWPITERLLSESSELYQIYIWKV